MYIPLPIRAACFSALLAIAVALAPGCDDETETPIGPNPEPDGWFRLDTVPTTRELTSVHAIDLRTVVAVGDSGTVLRTTDGGDVWTLLQLDTDARLGDLDFAGADTAYSIGRAGAAFKSVDGGSSWESLSVPSSGDLRSASFVDGRHGWIVGGYWPEQDAAGIMARTDDGGESWTTWPGDQQVNMVWACGVDTACVVFAAGDVSRTTNGGQSWETSSSSAPGWIGGIWFSNSFDGWISGSAGFLARSDDGGTSWTPATSGTTRNLVDVYFRGEQRGVAVGQLGTIIQTDDGGDLWTFRTSGTSAHLRMTSFADDATGWIVGTQGTVLKTVTAGEPR
jgi:photosystem II stability/assembly factor-like uncharacterized protein